MIVVRDVFRLKFGQAKEAVSLWKQAAELLTQAGFKNVRLLTDLVGPAYYTVILESTYDSLSDWESAHRNAPGQAEWKAIYAKIIPLTEEGRREILTVVQ